MNLILKLEHLKEKLQSDFDLLDKRIQASAEGRSDKGLTMLINAKLRLVRAIALLDEIQANPKFADVRDEKSTDLAKIIEELAPSQKKPLMTIKTYLHDDEVEFPDGIVKELNLRDGVVRKKRLSVIKDAEDYE